MGIHQKFGKSTGFLLTGGKEAEWNSRKENVFTSMETVSIKHYSDYVILAWWMIPFFRKGEFTGACKKGLLLHRCISHLFAQPEEIVSRLCHVFP